MTAQAQWDVCVVGLGAMGASTAWHCARRGARVLGLDAHSVPNTQGSSHGGSRAFRMAYFEHPGYVPLLRRALELWRELEAQAGTELLHLTGGVYIGLPDSTLVRGSIAAAELHGLDYTLLDQLALCERWPQFAVPEGLVGIHEPLAGVCRVEETIGALARLARDAGAELHEHEAVLDWQVTADGVLVQTEGFEYKTKRLVLCPGAFANSLLKTVAFGITPTRQVVGWFTPEQPQRAGLDSFPVWALELPDGRFWYGFAALPGSPGLKLGSHRPGTAVDPAAEPRQARPAEALELLDFAEEWLPEDTGALAASSVCLYENSPDGHFILGWHPACARRDVDERRVLVACGGSGHAFKFTPVIGEIMAELALDGVTRHATGFLEARRFSV